MGALLRRQTGETRRRRSPCTTRLHATGACRALPAGLAGQARGSAWILHRQLERNTRDSLALQTGGDPGSRSNPTLSDRGLASYRMRLDGMQGRSSQMYGGEGGIDSAHPVPRPAGRCAAQAACPGGLSNHLSHHRGFKSYQARLSEVQKPNYHMYGGEGGIRTLDTRKGMPHFECGAFDHSATSPQRLPQPLCGSARRGCHSKQNRGR